MTTKTTMKLPTRMIACLLVLAATPTFAEPQPAAPKDATEATRAVNRAALADLPMSDKQSFEDARRGLVEALGDQVVMGDGGRRVWSLQGYEFLAKEEAPDTVNPGLWRQAGQHGQRPVQGHGTAVPGARPRSVEHDHHRGRPRRDRDRPLVTAETAKAALELLRHRPRKPVTALIYSHSHGDHFGGARVSSAAKRSRPAWSGSSRRPASWKKRPARTRSPAAPWRGTPSTVRHPGAARRKGPGRRRAGQGAVVRHHHAGRDRPGDDHHQGHSEETPT